MDFSSFLHYAQNVRRKELWFYCVNNIEEIPAIAGPVFSHWREIKCKISIRNCLFLQGLKGEALKLWDDYKPHFFIKESFFSTAE
mmetsp:Transcript_17922/g.12908  ORF Transcript_17922/g.12908 Transcript_17922/m.12908 type:complete len:85 (+) Transcript_17922:233-487(+)